ncbi:MAG: mechanosensitive ion channel family protein [Erysipelotrichaceae bacterium]|nr:mechanosensitive ion channel family protein [Erysipelotrichaceae bacterium]MDD4642033.1 mechanosensitive ion channel family protein [Erysipelotrichaceae bacterium]
MNGVIDNTEESIGFMSKLWNTIQDNLFPIISAAFMIIIFAIAAKLILNQLSKYTAKTIKKASENPDEQKSRELVTAMTLLRSIGRYVIYFIFIALVLYQLGFGDVIGNLMVTAGFGSLAISFGAQSIVKDVVTGFFMMFEKQYAVGDFVKIGEYEGVVTSIAMRVTYLRSFKGQKIIIPNGTITNVINYSNDYNTAVITVPTPYEANTKDVIAIVQEELNNYKNDNEDLFIENPKVMGVSGFNGSSVDLTVVAKVKALNQWQVERDIRLLIKERFDKDGIDIPYQQVVVHKANVVEKSNG